MTERGILFNGDMVRALLEGRKTVTRRIFNPQPPGGDARKLVEVIWGKEAEKLTVPHEKTSFAWAGFSDDRSPCHTTTGYYRCPYGQPGDRLWVRETFATDGHRNVCYRESVGNGESPREGCVYADSSEFNADKWTPSIHMPRWASRILLEITDVRAERLHDISQEDARAEGYPAAREAETGGSDMDAWLWFRQLWKGISGAESWETNPWVWVVEFKRIN